MILDSLYRPTGNQWKYSASEIFGKTTDFGKLGKSSDEV